MWTSRTKIMISVSKFAFLTASATVATCCWRVSDYLKLVESTAIAPSLIAALCTAQAVIAAQASRSACSKTIKRILFSSRSLAPAPESSWEDSRQKIGCYREIYFARDLLYFHHVLFAWIVLGNGRLAGSRGSRIFWRFQGLPCRAQSDRLWVGGLLFLSRR